jgi:AraC-like DNA-binding protein
MSFVQQIADAISTAPARVLDALSQSIWQGLQAGALNDDDAQRLAELIHARRTAAKATAEATDGRSGRRSLYPVRKPQRAPVRAAAIERRRRLASSGPLPPSLAAKFTVGELACLRIIGDECRGKGACMLTIAEIAARAGVSRTTVQNATRQATREGLILVQERRQPGALNLPNKITIVSKEWRAWLLRGPKQTGFKTFDPTDTNLSSRPVERAESSARDEIRAKGGGSR